MSEGLAILVAISLVLAWGVYDGRRIERERELARHRAALRTIVTIMVDTSAFVAAMRAVTVTSGEWAEAMRRFREAIE